MASREPLIQVDQVVRLSELGGTWLRGPDGIPIKLHYSPFSGTILSVGNSRTEWFAGCVFQDAQATTIQSRFGSGELCTGVVRVTFDGSGLLIKWPTGEWRKQSSESFFSLMFHRLLLCFLPLGFLPASDGGRLWALWFRLMSQPCMGKIVTPLTCLKWPCLLICILIYILGLVFLVAPRFFVLHTWGINCPEKVESGLVVNPYELADLNCKKWLGGNRSSELGSEPMGSLPEPLRECFETEVFQAMQACPFVLQVEKGTDAPTMMPQACFWLVCLSFATIFPFMIFHRMVAPGPTMPRQLVGLTLALCFVLATFLPHNVGLVCFFAAAALGLAYASAALRRELTALAEPCWPRVQPLQDSLAVVQEFEKHCSTSQASYDCKLEVWEVFGVEWPRTPCIRRHDVEAGSLNIQRLYHGTSAQCVENILSEGFDLRHASNGLLGQAIYFAETPLKSWRYSQSGYVLACDVALGRTLEVRNPFDQLPDDKGSCRLRDPFSQVEKFDSVLALAEDEGGQVRAREYAIYSVDQIAPRFLVKVRSRPKVLDTVLEDVSDEDAAEVQILDRAGDGSVPLASEEDDDQQEMLGTQPSTDHDSQQNRGQRRSHNQRRRERKWRNQVQAPTPERSD